MSDRLWCYWCCGGLSGDHPSLSQSCPRRRRLSAVWVVGRPYLLPSPRPGCVEPKKAPPHDGCSQALLGQLPEPDFVSYYNLYNIIYACSFYSLLRVHSLFSALFTVSMGLELCNITLLWTTSHRRSKDKFDERYFSTIKN